MPRRVQDYPYAFTSWHSMASLGHIIVLIAIFNFLLLLVHSAFFKRPLNARGHGFPFVTSRLSGLVLDKATASQAALATQLLGLPPIRTYVFSAT